MSRKAVPAPKAAIGKGFNVADYASKYHLPESEVQEYKNAFDLFDSDQGGSIDTKGNNQIT